jgi:hypothetical protein
VRLLTSQLETALEMLQEHDRAIHGKNGGTGLAGRVKAQETLAEKQEVAIRNVASAVFGDPAEPKIPGLIVEVEQSKKLAETTHKAMFGVESDEKDRGVIGYVNASRKREKLLFSLAGGAGAIILRWGLDVVGSLIGII